MKENKGQWREETDSKGIIKNTDIVAYSPHAGNVEAQKPQGTQVRKQQWSAAELRLTSPPFPRSAPHHVLLGYAVNTGSRISKEASSDLHNITRDNTQCCVLLHVRLQHL
jgi:hypothetical protein